MRFLIATTAALIMGTATAQAACTLEDIADNWTTAQTNTSEICGMRIETNGKMTGTCRTYGKGGQVTSSVSVKGSIEIDEETCAITGKIKKQDTTRSIQGNMTPQLDIIVGTIRRASGFIAYRDVAH